MMEVILFSDCWSVDLSQGFIIRCVCSNWKFLYSILQSMKSIGYCAASINGSKYLNDQIKYKLYMHKIKHHQSLKDFESLKFTDVTIHFENGEIIKFPDFSLKKEKKCYFLVRQELERVLY